jgi:hypothetical protein
MWTLSKKVDDEIQALWIELDGENGKYFIFPIFTTTESAIDFVGDIKFEGKLIKINKIQNVDDIANLVLLLSTQPASAVILNSPNIKTLEEDEDCKVIYWTYDDFMYIIDQALKITDSYDDENQAIEILDRYLNEKSASFLDLE